eukprot:g71546.t1
MAEMVGAMAAMRLGAKKGAKKGGERKARSPKQIRERGAINVLFRQGSNNAYLFDDDDMPALQDGEIAHRAVFKSYKNETKAFDLRVVLFEDGHYEVFKSLDNVNSITKGKNVDVIYKGIDGKLALPANNAQAPADGVAANNAQAPADGVAANNAQAPADGVAANNAQAPADGVAVAAEF